MVIPECSRDGPSAVLPECQERRGAARTHRETNSPTKACGEDAVALQGLHDTHHESVRVRRDLRLLVELDVGAHVDDLHEHGGYVSAIACHSPDLLAGASSAWPLERIDHGAARGAQIRRADADTLRSQRLGAYCPPAHAIVIEEGTVSDKCVLYATTHLLVSQRILVQLEDGVVDVRAKPEAQCDVIAKVLQLHEVQRELEDVVEAIESHRGGRQNAIATASVPRSINNGLILWMVNIRLVSPHGGWAIGGPLEIRFDFGVVLRVVLAPMLFVT